MQFLNAHAANIDNPIHSDSSTKGYKMGDLGKLFWALQKHGVSCLEFLTSAEGRKDESMTKKLEEWLWKEENTILAASFKTVRPRHVTIRTNTDG